MKTLLHVNYYERPGGLDELFKIAKEFGYDGVELRWKYHFSDMSQKEYEKKIISLKKEYPEFEITFVGVIDFCRGKTSIIEQETAEYLDFMEWAKVELNTKVMNFFTGMLVNNEIDLLKFYLHGSKLALNDDYERSANGLRNIGAKATELDILIALETHNCYLHDLPDSSRKLLDMTNHSAIGMNIDYGNIFLNKNKSSISETFKILDGKIYYAHLKNVLISGEQFMITHLNQGDINNMDFLYLLKDRLKSGMLTLEYPSHGDGIIAAKKDMEYLKFLKHRLKID
jgi:sugar phosphate isomerase/epimerase